MYLFTPNFDERFYVIKIVGEFTESDCRNFIQDMINFSAKIGYRRFGSINDMRDFTDMNPITHEILTRGMKLSLKLGFTVVGRVYNDITDKMNQSMSKANIEAGFVACYFREVDKAITFVKEALSDYATEPVTTKEEVEELITEEFPEYKIPVLSY